MALEYPRFVHGPGGAHLLVHSESEKEAALKKGWHVSPVLSAEQQEVVRKAQIAAGEIAPEPPKVETPEPRKSGSFKSNRF